MGAEALQIQTSETNNVPLEKVDEAFKSATQALYKFSNDPRFIARCEQQGLNDIDATERPEYWQLLGDMAQSVVQKQREAGNDTLKMRAFELVATTPAYTYAQDYLDGHPHDRSYKNQEARSRASTFNHTVREFASTTPGLHASTLSKNLLNVVNISVQGHAKHSAAQHINRSIRGAQHELGFDQLLEHTGREYWQGSTQQDLRGTDRIVASHDGASSLQIDVKASMHDINDYPTTTPRPYHIRPDGRVTMYSLIQNHDFRDTFRIPDELAEQKAVVLDSLLAQIEQGDTEIAYAV